MRLPRDLSGDDLVRRLRVFGYEPTRQTGSHIRLTRESAEGTHNVTVPRHESLRVGTLNSILNAIASRLDIDKADLVRRISGQQTSRGLPPAALFCTAYSGVTFPSASTRKKRPSSISRPWTFAPSVKVTSMPYTRPSCSRCTFSTMVWPTTTVWAP